MEYKDIQVEVQDAIATVTLNRPHKLNAYTNLMGDELTHAAAREMASQIASLPPLALAVSKRALQQGAENDFDAAVQTETFGLEYLFKTQDHREAVAAFLDKREPQFRGK